MPVGHNWSFKPIPNTKKKREVKRFQCSTQKSRGWKSSPQKTSESGKEAEWWSVGHNSEWLNSEWHNKTGTWQDSSWSRSTWKSSKMAPGPPGSPRNVDSNSEDVRGDGEEEDKDESEEDAARI